MVRAAGSGGGELSCASMCLTETGGSLGYMEAVVLGLCGKRWWFWGEAVSARSLRRLVLRGGSKVCEESC